LASQDPVTGYRKRPLILSVPHLTTYNVIKERSAQLLAHHKDTGINYLKLTVEGNVNLHYAAQSVTVNIPEFTINNGIFYINELHHVAEPQKDVTGGYGFDYITEVELVPITGVAYDMSRLGDRQVYSPTQLGTWSGAGLGIK